MSPSALRTHPAQPDVRLLLARLMPRTYAALLANGATAAQLAQALPATAVALSRIIT